MFPSNQTNPERLSRLVGESLPDVLQLTRSLLAGDSRNVYREIIQEVEQILVQEVMRSTDGKQVQAADRLGISRMTLRAKLKAFTTASPGSESHETR